MKVPANIFAADAIHTKGWWGAHRWLLLRRITQLTILALFLVGPWFGWWLVKGNLNYSLTLGTLPLAATCARSALFTAYWADGAWCACLPLSAKTATTALTALSPAPSNKSFVCRSKAPTKGSAR